MNTQSKRISEKITALAVTLILLLNLVYVPTRTLAASETTQAIATTQLTGGGQSHVNMQPYLTLNYIISLQGTFPSRSSSPNATSAVNSEPFIGEIRIFAGNFAPRGWAFCDGQILPIAENTALFSILGTIYGGDGRTTFALPDLRGRVPIGAGSGPGLPSYIIGQKGGAETHTLFTNEIPVHNHALGSTSTGNTGSSVAHNNQQPYLAINYLVALVGVYPSQSGGFPEEPYVGEIRMFAGNFAPRGYAFADGSLLAVSSNDALFSLFGTIYGGDGRTTFGLPDLRGRAPVSSGTGAGLTPRTIGQKFGATTVTLTSAEMPSHQHGSLLGNTQDTGGGQTHVNVQPTLVINFKVISTGLFPSRNSSIEFADAINNEGMLAEVRLVGFNNPDLLPADGQLLDINSNQSLYSLLGTTYGGNGRTDFALPDLRGRTPIHKGQGTGLSNYTLGSRSGFEQVTLTLAQLPAHTHSLLGEIQCGVTASTAYTFATQSNVVIDVTSTGTDLDCLYVEEVTGNHPNASTGLQTGKYWIIEGTKSDQLTAATEDFDVAITLPHSVVPDTNAKVCKYTGVGLSWDCDRNTSAANTVTRHGISSLSDWAVGDGVGPNAVELSQTNATSYLAISLVAVSSFLVLLSAGVFLLKRERQQV